MNRTLTANVWNTFASPFAIAAGDMEKYFGAGAKVRQLNTTSVAENVLTLNFTNATEIEAGPAEGTYDLSGRRIQGQPTHKGVYIQNGKKVVIK